MDKPLVSVIMPAFNAADYIFDSISSVIGQTYENWELIVVDDGSTDGTADKIKHFTTDARIKYLYQENGKQGKARNAGIKCSSGQWIAFLDADDRWLPDKLQVQTSIIADGHFIDLLFSQGYYWVGTETMDYPVQVKEIWDIADMQVFLDKNQVPILSVLVKKEVLEQAGLFSETGRIQNAEDYHLWLKLLIGNFKFCSTADKVFFYRVHHNQSTYNNQHLESPLFYTYEDIYHQCLEMSVKQKIVQKLKWYIYNHEFHGQCIKLFSLYFAQKREWIISFAIRTVFSRPLPFCQKIVFYIVSFLG